MATKRGKKYIEAAKLVDPKQTYQPEEAVGLVKQTSYAKFDATVETHVRLGVDVRHADQQVRGTVALPSGTGREVRVVVFAQGDAARAATEAGANRVGAEDLATDIQGGWLDFDVAIASPDMMRIIGGLGRILGPRGLMPNARTGTVTPDVARAVREVKGGRVEFRTDRAGLLHVPIGKVSFTPEQIMDNFRALLAAVIAARPSGAKGQYIRTVTLTSTMGPGVGVDLAAVAALA
ncbi:MAG: LSU ribosomal protein L1p (L10Ae) [uncultured Chloroflexi bacterium]|uniref:Large ribosomal subunit protein uL1 n=1 Tax=uncultured Chloroflexota bacterium TaxID=166587 RepID=A0A6J4I5H8_9CHLR|nr:MAG: LSU ribosomal protein L1p (L10Ae) [uncultured Chloroflexota bacterium]